MNRVIDEGELERNMNAKYGISCPLCGSRIDEQARCTCGAGGA